MFQLSEYTAVKNNDNPIINTTTLTSNDEQRYFQPIDRHPLNSNRENDIIFKPNAKRTISSDDFYSYNVNFKENMNNVKNVNNINDEHKFNDKSKNIKSYESNKNYNNSNETKSTFEKKNKKSMKKKMNDDDDYDNDYNDSNDNNKRDDESDDDDNDDDDGEINKTISKNKRETRKTIVKRKKTKTPNFTRIRSVTPSRMTIRMREMILNNQRMLQNVQNQLQQQQQYHVPTVVTSSPPLSSVQPQVVCTNTTYTDRGYNGSNNNNDEDEQETKQNTFLKNLWKFSKTSMFLSSNVCMAMMLLSYTGVNINDYISLSNIPSYLMSSVNSFARFANSFQFVRSITTGQFGQNNDHNAAEIYNTDGSFNVSRTVLQSTRNVFNGHFAPPFYTQHKF